LEETIWAGILTFDYTDDYSYSKYFTFQNGGTKRKKTKKKGNSLHSSSAQSIFIFATVVVWPQLATKAPSGSPSPRRAAEENGKKQAEIGGSGQGQFNRTANKGNRNNNDTEKEKTQHKPHNSESLSLGAPPLRAPKPRVSSRPPAPPPPERSMTAHGMEYTALFGRVGSAHPAVPLPGFWWKLTLSWLNPGQLSTPYSIPTTSCPGPPLSSWSPPLLLSPDIIPLVYGSSL